MSRSFAQNADLDCGLQTPNTKEKLMYDYVKRNKILATLGKRLAKENIPVISKDERQALLYWNARSVYKRFPIKYLESESIDVLQEKFKTVLSKAESFALEQKLVNVMYTIDYDHVLISGYRPVSDQELIEKYKKWLKQKEKQTEKYRQSKANNKSEALREINRLKRKFKI